jgi:hypothetical protein
MSTIEHTPRMMAFIAKVTSIYFKDDQSKYNELVTILESIPKEANDEKDDAIENKNIKTTDKNKNIKTADKNVKTADKKTCTVLFKIGEKKGLMCGKTCHASSETMCSTHLKAQQKKEEKSEEKSKEKSEEKSSEETTGQPIPKVKTTVQTTLQATGLVDTKKKRVTVKQKKQEDREKKTLCNFVLKSGDNIGKECGRVCAEDKILCAVHIRSTEADKKKQETTTKKEKKEPVYCTGMLKNNAACTNKAVDGTTTCKMHTKESVKKDANDAPENKTLRLKRDGERYLVKGTNVLFDITRQCIIGYKKDEQYIFEENNETKEICHSYALPFEKK